MTTTFEATMRTRTIAAGKPRKVISTLAVAASLLALSAPGVHAAPNDGHGTEPGPPYLPGDQIPPLALPPILAEQNPVVFYGSETKKHVDMTWTPYKWGPVRFHYKAVGGTKLVGHHPSVDPDVADPHALMEVIYGRAYDGYLETPSLESKLIGPTLRVTTVRVELASTDPQPPRINPPSIPADKSHPDPVDARRLAPDAAERNSPERS